MTKAEFDSALDQFMLATDGVSVGAWLELRGMSWPDFQNVLVPVVDEYFERVQTADIAKLYMSFMFGVQLGWELHAERMNVT